MLRAELAARERGAELSLVPLRVPLSELALKLAVIGVLAVARAVRRVLVTIAAAIAMYPNKRARRPASAVAPDSCPGHGDVPEFGRSARTALPADHLPTLAAPAPP